MKDFMELINEVQKKNKGKSALQIQQEILRAIHSEIDNEIKKGTDLSPYLHVNVNVCKSIYSIALEIPLTSNIFDSISGNTE